MTGTIRRILAILCAAALVGFAPGCGGEDEPDSDSTTPDDAEAALPESVAATGADNVEIEDRLVHDVAIPDGPDWMTSAFGALWVKRDNGVVDRLDPATGKVLAEISSVPFKQPVCQGLGASDEAIWACPVEGSVVRIDPKSNSVTATVKVDKLLNQGSLVAAADRLWILTDAGNALTGIDLATNKPSKPIPLPAACFDLAVGGDTLWAVCPQDDLLLQIDAAAGEVTSQVGLPGAARASVSDQVWVSFDGGIAQVDPNTLEVVAVYDVFPGSYGGIYATEDAVWVREEQGTFLTRIDPDEQQIVERIKATQYPSGGDVIAIDDTIWATASDDNVLVGVRAGGG
jgi:streptogramin lyase